MVEPSPKILASEEKATTTQTHTHTQQQQQQQQQQKATPLMLGQTFQFLAGAVNTLV